MSGIDAPRWRAGQLAGGLLLVGVAGYYLLAAAGKSLPPREAAAVATIYLLANIIGPGLGTAIEQETSRAVSQALALRRDPSPAIWRMVRLCGFVMVVAGAIVLVISPVLVPRALDGQWGLLAALLLAIVTFGAVALVRGVLGGHRRLAGYAVTLAVEGIARLLPIAFLQMTGAASAVLFGLIFAAGSGCAAVAGMPWLRGITTPAPAAEVPRLGRSFGLLLGSSLLMQALANLAPVLAASRLTATPALAAALASGFVLARIPLFLFLPVQAVLLPRLVEAVTRGDALGLRRQIGLVLAAVGVVGGVGIAGSWFAGDWVLAAFFGARVTLAPWVLPVLASGTILMMAMQVLQPALLALHRHAHLLLAWCGGVAVLVVAASLPFAAATAAVIGQLAGSAVAVACAGWFVATAGGYRSAATAVAEPSHA